MVYGENAFLFTGDAEQEYEADLLKRYPKSRLAADVLKLGHHGSNTSSHADFLDTQGKSVEITLEACRQVPLPRRLLRHALRVMAPLL